MGKYSYHIVFMLTFIFAVILMWLLGIIDLNQVGRDSINCELHKDVFQSEINDARVVDKYIDYKNHGYKIVKMVAGEEKFSLYFHLVENERDFDRIMVSDKISKDRNSFIFEVNNSYSFKLGYNCSYDTIPNSSSH
ncbi:hypothetical protein [Echinicola salinicaeni]|uniref:hypothetical protein n=1 Tax=Echinicola salinicaeni TaxID=2762757 RepID=UPI00164527A8|nr:hypothetical protein [Echinicola salinicaeni]